MISVCAGVVSADLTLHARRPQMSSTFKKKKSDRFDTLKHLTVKLDKTVSLENKVKQSIFNNTFQMVECQM